MQNMRSTGRLDTQLANVLICVICKDTCLQARTQPLSSLMLCSRIASIAAVPAASSAARSTLEVLRLASSGTPSSHAHASLCWSAHFWHPPHKAARQLCTHALYPGHAHAHAWPSAPPLPPQWLRQRQQGSASVARGTSPCEDAGTRSRNKARLQGWKQRQRWSLESCMAAVQSAAVGR
jgi:hypothetical protein